MREDHSKKAPVIAEWIPKGRTRQDAIFYKTMRRLARVHREEIYAKSVNAMRQMFLYGVSLSTGFFSRGVLHASTKR